MTILFRLCLILLILIVSAMNQSCGHGRALRVGCDLHSECSELMGTCFEGEICACINHGCISVACIPGIINTCKSELVCDDYKCKRIQ